MGKEIFKHRFWIDNMISTKSKQSVYLSSARELRHKLKGMPFTPILNGINRNVFVRYYTEYEYALNFLKNGTLKFNKFSHLRKLDTNRADITEGDASFILKRNSQSVEKYSFRNLDIENDNLNVYCLSYLDMQDRKGLSIHKFLKKKRFDNNEKYAVVINEIDTFLNQTRTRFNAKGFDFENGYFQEKFVEYKHNKEMVFVNENDLEDQIFVKRKENFEGENEFRIVNNYEFNNTNLQLIDIGSIEQFAYLVNLEGENIFPCINPTFQFIVELCKLGKIESAEQLNVKLNESDVIIGQAFRDNPKWFFEKTGMPIEDDIEISVNDYPYIVSEHDFDKYIAPYIKQVKFSYFTIDKNMNKSNEE